MDLEFATLAEAANTLPDARLNILGAGIESIMVQKFPFIYPFMVIITRLTAHPTEVSSEHTLTIYLKDADGKDIINTIKIVIPPAPDKLPRNKKVAYNLIGHLSNIKFPGPGIYSVEILIDNRHAKSLLLEIRPVPAPHCAKEDLPNN